MTAAELETPPGIRWSDEQMAVFNWFEHGRGNLIVRARAGTGKTTTIVEGVQLAPERSILLAAFNKSIADELTGRIRSAAVEAKTLHGLGFAFIRRNWKVRIDRDRAERLAWGVVGERAPITAMRLVRELHTKAREVNPWANSAGDMIDVASRFDCVPDEKLEESGWTVERVAECALKAMATAREKTDAIDFADMIYLPLTLGWVRPWYDMVVVDEAQDMTVAQLAMARGACRRSGRVCIVGDDRQAIYSWRGAALDGIDMLKQELNAAELGLKTTRRCPQLVVEMAAQIVPDFVAADTAPIGELAATYVVGSQKLSGHAPALIRNATPRIAAPASNNARSRGASSMMRPARSAMFKVPVMP